MPRGTSAYDEARLQGRLWTPLNLGSALKAWWDPTQGLTMNGATISAWKDRVGGVNMSNSTASQQPAIAQFNNLQAVDFGTGGKYLSVAGPTIAQPMVAVSGFVTGASQPPYSRTYNTSGGIGLFPQRSDVGNFLDIYAGSNVALTNSVLAINTGFVSVASLNGASSLHWLDGTQFGPFNPGTRGLSGTLFFSSTDTANESFRGLFLDQMFCTALTSQQLTSLQGWMDWRWGLQTKLPASHPFKNRPPLIGD